jgi:hypothetical protein
MGIDLQDSGGDHRVINWRSGGDEVKFEIYCRMDQLKWLNIENKQLVHNIVDNSFHLYHVKYMLLH